MFHMYIAKFCLLPDKNLGLPSQILYSRPKYKSPEKNVKFIAYP